MDRVANWDVKIVQEIGSLVGTNFVWGKNDCVSLVRKLSAIMYDEDIFKQFMKRKYTTLIGATRAFKEAKYTFDEAVLEAGGWEIPHATLTDGDIAIVQEYEDVQNLSIMVGGRWIHANDRLGIILSHREIPLNNMKVYRI